MSDVAPLSLLSATVLMDASLEGWSLLEPWNDGTRVFRYHVSFSRTFSTPPVVQVGIVGLDVSKEDNLRIRVRPIDITSAGFTLEAETWLYTKIWSVDVSWLAIGS
ncbi:MAG: H-type lectin domain-containing protein [Polyangiaceae bacterium]